MIDLPKLKFARRKEKSVAVWLADPQSFATALAAPEKSADLPGEALRFAAATRFEAKSGRLMWFVGADGEAAAVFFVELGSESRSVPARRAGESAAARRLSLGSTPGKTRTSPR